MERFKKRTIALVLASVVTIAGTFASDNYKNSLTGLKFSGTGGSINMVVQTKSAYEGNITPIRKNANTYALILPEMNSQANSPSLKEVSADIASVNIRTMPYSNSAKGYTVITIRTQNPTINLSATNQVFIGETHSNQITDQNYYQQRNQQSLNNSSTENLRPKKKKIGKIEEDELSKDKYDSEKSGLIETPVSTASSGRSGLVETAYVPVQKQSTTASTENGNAFFWLWAILIVLVSALFYAKAKNKIQDLIGENLEINLADDSEQKTKQTKKLNKIKKTIDKLDSAYSKTNIMPGKAEYTAPTTAPVKIAKPAEELNIVDLDELFQEHKAKNTTTEEEEEENNALEEFLSGFSFDDTEFEQEAEISTGYDEEYYDKLINSKDFSFSKEEANCINQLLNTEINDDTMRNIDQYAVSSPVEIKPSKEKILENLVASYTISQNISFGQDDINTLYKLINVELDKDFITDLRTNPQKTKEMEQDILSYGDKPKKASEIITLSVKDMLPDLSEALKQQGNKKIESNHKAETVYFSEGYEVSTLSLEDSLPDLSIEINKKDAFKTKPSAKYEVVDTNYTVGDNVLQITSELPDLQDVMAHPEKYEKQEEKVIVDEESLLNNIANVQFKPFYDGTNEFEVLNDVSDAPSVSDIQQEFSQFEGFEIAQEENIENNSIQEDYDDFTSLYSNEYFDLDKNKDSLNVQESVTNEIIPNQNEPVTEIKQQNSAQELIKKIEATKIEREIRKARLVRKEAVKKIKESPKDTSTETIRCILNGSTYTVVSSSQIDEEKGCHLAKNENGYAILGYIGDKLINIKQYDSLKSERINVRMSEKISDEVSRYIVRIGVQKFIVNVTNDNIEFVMDLC